MGNLRKKTCGVHHFTENVTATDPCYNHKVWCRTDFKIKEGNYTCISWYDANERGESGTPRICGIYFDGKIPAQLSMEKLTDVGVDAGLCGFFNDKPDYSAEEWDDLCRLTRKGNAWIIDYGFFTQSGDGDGYYPVYVFRNKSGEIIAAEIRF